MVRARRMANPPRDAPRLAGHGSRRCGRLAVPRASPEPVLHPRAEPVQGFRAWEAVAPAPLRPLAPRARAARAAAAGSWEPSRPRPAEALRSGAESVGSPRGAEGAVEPRPAVVGWPAEAARRAAGEESQAARRRARGRPAAPAPTARAASVAGRPGRRSRAGRAPAPMPGGGPP